MATYLNIKYTKYILLFISFIINLDNKLYGGINKDTGINHILVHITNTVPLPIMKVGGRAPDFSAFLCRHYFYW